MAFRRFTHPVTLAAAFAYLPLYALGLMTLRGEFNGQPLCDFDGRVTFTFVFPMAYCVAVGWWVETRKRRKAVAGNSNSES